MKIDKNINFLNINYLYRDKIHKNQSNQVMKIESKENDSSLTIETEQEAKQIEEAEKEIEQMRQDMLSAREQAEAAKQLGELITKCFTIARRIISGDIVPKEDKEYLQQSYPELYAQAITLRQKKEDPTQHKSILGEAYQMKEILPEGHSHSVENNSVESSPSLAIEAQT